jgi:hypothetical protein
MIAVLLVWILLAPIGAWIIGAGIRLSEQRRPLVADDAADEGSCQQADVDELVAAG